LSKEWSVNDVVDRMTSVDKYGEAKVKPFQAAQKLLHPDNSSQLQRIKSKLTLGKDTDNHKAWFAMAQTPILEALEAAGKKTSKVSVDGESLFDVKAFATRINKLDPKTQRILWGDKGSADIQKAIKAWELKGKQSNGRAINLGGAEASAKAASGLIVRMLAPAGRAGGTLLASTPILKEAIDGFKSNRIDKSGATLAAGGQSRAMLKAREEAIKEELKTLCGRDNYKQFSTAVEYVVRTIARDEE
jgi:hypothetical protein